MDSIAIVNGDAFGLLEGLSDGFGQAAVVDYPWEFANGSRPGQREHENSEDWTMQDNDRLGAVLSEVRRVLAPGSWVFVFADDDVYPAFRRATERALEFRKTLIWDTERIGTGHYFRGRHQYILAATAGDTDRYVTDVPTVLEAPAKGREPGETGVYPTEKPASLYRQFIAPVVKPGERILEPFCGSAPGLEVAKSLGCTYWGCDISDDALRRARGRKGQSTFDTL